LQWIQFVYEGHLVKATVTTAKKREHPPMA